jgi:DNA-binding transcriptional regulator PaaX
MKPTFRRFPSTDPELAETIAPGAAARAAAVATFDAIYEALEPAASEHFAEVALAPVSVSPPAG